MVFPFINLTFVNMNYPHMKNTSELMPKKDYMASSLRVCTTKLETSFLQSNLEPIGGGDDPDIDW